MKQLFLATLLGSTIAMCTAAMAADTDLKTLEAAAKADAAHLEDVDPAPLLAVIPRDLLQADDAMHGSP